jgi:PAS domain S-box-containing protein
MSESSPDEIVRGALAISAKRLRRQHEAAVQFGLAALRMHSVDQVLEEACKVAARGMDSRFAKVLRFIPEENALLLEAGIGWDAGEIGTTKLSADDASPAGYAYASGKPVLSNHLGEEHRFRTPALLARHGVKRAINVPIRSTADAYGVLEADSDNGEDFIETDIVFLEAVANVIALARERISVALEAERDQIFSTSVLNSSNDCILVMSTGGAIEFVNDFGLTELSISDSSAVKGRQWTSLYAPQEAAQVAGAIALAACGESSRFETTWMREDGQPRWWDVSIAPMRDRDDTVQHVVAVCRDITERHENEMSLATLLSEQETQLSSSELMMKEVHHRVRNSLQLVQTLLSLQGSLAGDGSVKSQLQTASSRVMTVGLVHQRLYQENGVQETDARTYLQELIGDLQGTAGDRVLEFKAPSIVLPAKRLAPLGLVTAELIMNALKYGQGTITVTLSPSDAGLLLTVEDQGPGFPDDFPTPKGTGLGMRLVTTYSGVGAGAVNVDRSVPHAKITVRFRSA